MTVRLGGDYSFARPSMSELQSLGITFVARYVSPEASKNLSLSEAQELSNAGIDIVTNFEDGTSNWTGGYNQGVADARLAWGQHKACGGPDGRPVYFSVDEDIDPTDSRLHAYFQGCGAGMTPGQIGVYGSAAVCDALKAAGLVHWTWRTMSTGWRGGVGNPSDFNVEQTGFFNSSIDRDASITDDFGQWRVGQAPTPAPGGGAVATAMQLEIWGYKGDDATGPADEPDVHQSLLTTRDNTNELVAAVKALTAEVAAIKAKLGA